MADTVYSKLLQIQSELKAPKSKYNKFGKFNYRSCEDILEAVKPLCKKYGMLLLLSEEVISFDGSYDETLEETDEETKRPTGKVHISGEGYRYIKATATIINIDDEKSVSSSASVREAVRKKGMDTAQISGTTSSYAKKRSLSNLFAIDDSDDVDGEEPPAEAPQRLDTKRKPEPSKTPEPQKKPAQSAPQKATKANPDVEERINNEVRAAAKRTDRKIKDVVALVKTDGFDFNNPDHYDGIIKYLQNLKPAKTDLFE